MGLLKKAKRNAAPAVNQLAEKVKQVNDLEALGALTLNPDEPSAVMYRELWNGRDNKYKENFTANVFRVWALTHLKRVQELGGVSKIIFSIFDKETNEPLGTYSDARGFRGQ
ncbi:MAG TPA: hypothetical protein VNQ80_15505 [Parapedobacter sp.]|uniref:hypothetical protein n=1 Tax=Parapedobacter sp. TaxID=1958893 RepID=UPI002B78E3F6|nr:hypothetical protein [Parapedobacter sp.]HWK58749.1 hypothetical protein [Parapedobacter sp.]